MRRRDRLCRAGGALLIVAGFALGLAARRAMMTPGAGFASATLGSLALVIVGLVLAVGGRHVPAAFRIERSRHRDLADAIRRRRARLRG